MDGISLRRVLGAGVFALLATATNIVGPLPASAVPGRNTVSITSDDQLETFLQAIDTPNSTIYLGNNVNLDLTGRSSLRIRPGVQILGGRSSTEQGGRLFTTTPDITQFWIGQDGVDADNVRISGIRLEGADLDIADGGDNRAFGIYVISSVNVDISNNEIYGWSGSAVRADDPRGRINLKNASAVRVSDNYIHHNRHYGGNGYGVETKESAYATIERNVFDHNRHAIASGGEPGNGYLAYRNLVLENGGTHFKPPASDFRTHMLDVHGTRSDCGWESLWRDHYCGDGGEYFGYQYNSIFYTAGNAIYLRGKASIRADIKNNVFAHSNELVAQPPLDHVIKGAYGQSDGHSIIPLNNEFGVSRGDLGTGQCDFDGNGQLDKFMATGVTWWYQTARGWFYLNTSTKKRGDVELADFDHDGRCDVRTKAEGYVFSGGRNAAPARTDIKWNNKSGTLPLGSVWQVSQSAVQRDFVPRGPYIGSFVAGGDFDGNGVVDDAMHDQQTGQVSVAFLDEDSDLGGLVGTVTQQQGIMPLTTKAAGAGDFDADGRADILWRHADGRLEIWFSGMAGNRATPSYANQGGLTTVDWSINGIGDFNGDGRADILWRNQNGQVGIWLMDGATMIGDFYPGGKDPTRAAQIQGVGDFNGDGKADILWRWVRVDSPPPNGSGLTIWFSGLNTTTGVLAWQNNPNHVVESAWQIKGFGDFNGDRRADVLWQHTSGRAAIWLLNGATYLGEFQRDQDPNFEPVAVKPVFQYGPGIVKPPLPPEHATVPDVLHRTPLAATTALEAAGFVRGEIKYTVDDNCNYIGKVVGQSPGALSSAPKGSAVNLWLGQIPQHPCP